MKRVTSFLTFLITLCMIVLTVVGCTPKPNSVTKELLDTLKKYDYAKANMTGMTGDV